MLTEGAADLASGPFAGRAMTRFDSFYLPADAETEVVAVSDCVFYSVAAPCDGTGTPSFRAYDATLPIGDIHQIHGAGAGRREVMFLPSTRRLRRRG